MSALFSSPKSNAQSVYTAAPSRSDAEVQADTSARRQRLAASSGAASTLLTATSDTAAPDAKKTLLGS